MQTIRRLYLYALTFVSLETVLWGTINLLRSILSGGQIGGGSSRLAGSLSLILVGVPVFLLHGWLVQRSVYQDAEERSARVRAVLLYAALLATLIPLVQNILVLLDRFLVSAFNLDPQLAFIGRDQTFIDNLVAIFLNGLAAAGLFSVLRADWLASSQGEEYFETRRLYRYVWLLYGLGLVLFGVQQVLQFLIEIPRPVGNESLLANGLALLLTGLPLWFFIERRIRSFLSEPSERQSLLRLVVLYILVFVSIGNVLISTGLVLDTLLRVVLGEELSQAGLLSQVSVPLSIAIPFGLIWSYYGHALRLEMSAFPNQPRRLAFRRLYLYVLALLGLGAVFVGLQQLLSTLLNLALGSSSLNGPGLRDPLAEAISFLVIGLPLWVAAWRPMVLEAAQEGETGDYARRSVVRKAYLYVILFVGVLGVMYGAGMLLFQLLRALLGDVPEDLLLRSLQQLRITLVFALLLAYHWQALQADTRMAARTLARRYAQFPVLVFTPDTEIPGGDGAGKTQAPTEFYGDFATTMVAALRSQAPTLPVAVHLISQGAPDESLSAARAVILPAELIAKTPEAIRLWLQAFPGIRLIIPTPTKGWLWLFGGSKSLPSLARQTAQIVRQLAEGEEVFQVRETPPLQVLAYVLAGLFTLQIILALFGIAASLILSR